MKGTVFIVTAVCLIFYGNCQEIRNLSVTLDKPYEISCDIKGLKNAKVCWVTTPWEENLPAFPPGITLDDGRIEAFGDANFCGARVVRATQPDEGTWRCNYAVQTSRSTDIQVLETHIVVEDPAFISKPQDPMPEISKIQVPVEDPALISKSKDPMSEVSKVQVAVEELTFISKSPDSMLEISKVQVPIEDSAFIAKSKDTLPEIPEILVAVEDKSSNVRSQNLIPRSRKEVNLLNPFIRTF